MTTDHQPWAGPEEAPEASRVAQLPVISLGIAVAATFLLAWLAESVVDRHIGIFDGSIRATVHSWSSPALTQAMLWISFLGAGGLVVAALLAFALFRHFRWRGAAIWMVVTLAGTLVLDLALKYAFHRARPEPFFGPIPRTYSFPSGHALFSFCFYGVLAGLIAKRLNSHLLRAVVWACAAALVLAIGLSRIYLGVHYASDVLAGYLTGTIWVATMLFLDRWRKNKQQRA